MLKINIIKHLVILQNYTKALFFRNFVIFWANFEPFWPPNSPKTGRNYLKLSLKLHRVGFHKIFKSKHHKNNF